MRVPILGSVSAGQPMDYIPIVNWRTIRPIRGRQLNENYACARVVGDSLANAGVFDGDIVIFRLTNEARPGDLIVALTPMGLTIKYLDYADGRILLRCANPACSDQQWDPEDVRIQGVVKRVERDL